MDDPAQRARMRALGYSEEPFYRGEASGRAPEAYNDAFFSRDPGTAKGFATRGGGGPREFRLNLQNTFSDWGRLNAGRLADIVRAATETGDHKLAASLVDAVAPGKEPEWFFEFAKRNPDVTVAESGGARLLRHAIERGSRAPDALFKSAGFNAIDVGTDVRKLSGEGIRLKDAAFDPARAGSRNIRAGWLLPLAVGGLAYDAASTGAEAAGLDEDAASNRGLVAGGIAGGLTAAAPYVARAAGRVMAPVAAVMSPFETGQARANATMNMLDAFGWHGWPSGTNPPGRNPAIPR